jgi:hypothetical protein
MGGGALAGRAGGTSWAATSSSRSSRRRCCSTHISTSPTVRSSPVLPDGPGAAHHRGDYWATLCAYLLLYASAWRGVGGSGDAGYRLTHQHGLALFAASPSASTRSRSTWACRGCWRFGSSRKAAR